MSLKNPLTLAGIEPATFRFVAQHLNHCATAMIIIIIIILITIVNSCISEGEITFPIKKAKEYVKKLKKKVILYM